jgi:hypothetical protein
MTRLSSRAGSIPIIGASLETPIRYNDPPSRFVKGDTWSTAWAEDDVLYVATDDTPGWNDALEASKGRNLAVNSFGTSTPPGLVGALVNSMDAYGYGGQLGDDGASWKADGLVCVDGVLYLSVSRHWYGKPETNNVQISKNSTIVKSDDYGSTWNSEPPTGEPFPSPMFPGPKFATPFFVQYDKDGAPPTPVVDEADGYVYAVSTDGYWDNGNAMHLGRVRRERLPDLDASQWEFYTGMENDTPRWQNGLAGLAAAAPMLSAEGRCGQTAVHFIPGLKRYVMPQWSYPDLTARDFNVTHSIWEFYEAPHPWGPWTLFRRWDWPTEGFYNPTIPNKFIGSDGRSMWLLTTGDFMTYDRPPDTTKYTLYMMRMTLQTAR